MRTGIPDSTPLFIRYGLDSSASISSLVFCCLEFSRDGDIKGVDCGVGGGIGLDSRNRWVMIGFILSWS